jgi:putative RNA 2'-phosphotransferase
VTNEKLVRVSKFLAKHLRHDPAGLGLTLEPGGWVNIDDLLAGAAKKGMRISLDDLEEVVECNDKKRFAIDGDKIRANQGHSTEVDLQLVATTPPDVLYHGTPERFIASIKQSGLKKMKRHHVHLSKDVETAIKVGQRRGFPVILIIDSKRMAEEGHEFFVSANGVWLTDAVPVQYIRFPG